jgi:hypothetical protein
MDVLFVFIEPLFWMKKGAHTYRRTNEELEAEYYE